jgi:transketolase
VRSGFIKALMELAENDDRIFLLVGDVGYSLVEPFTEKFPDRFVNIGIAEQNMSGIATGLALSGRVVFTYSLANFPTLRCVEQIRNDICYHEANVKIVTSGAGLAYGALGPTHHVIEDIAVMRALPNMTVIAPCDPIEAALATQAAATLDGPCYLRLAKTGDPVVHNTLPDFRTGKAITIRDGADLTIVACGGIILNAIKAAGQLERRGIQTRVLSMHTVKPLDTDAVLAAVRETGTVISIEEHSIVGGLGSAVAETLSESGITNIIFKRMGINGCFCTEVGSQEYLRHRHALSVEDIVAQATRLLRSRLKEYELA